MEYSIGAFKIFDSIAHFVRNSIKPNRLLALEFRTLNFQRFLGIVITALGLILSIVFSIKTDKLSILLLGIMWLFAFPLLFWSNLKIIKNVQLLSLKYKSRVNDHSYLEIVAVFYLFGAVACLAASIYFAVLLSSITALVSGLIICFSILISTSYIARHELLGIEFDPSAAIWENAICLFSIPLRLMSRLAGLAFAIANKLLVFALLYAIYLAVSGPNFLSLSQIFMGLAVMGGAAAAIYLGSPLFVYLITLPLYLLMRVLAQFAGVPESYALEKPHLSQMDVHLNFVSKGQEQTVVMDGEFVRDFYLSGTMNPDTLVWMEGMDEWQPASEVGF